MIDKDFLRDQLARECDIIRHLATKLPSGTDDWRPTEGQRSVLELLRYLSFCGVGGARAMSENDWNGYKEAEQEAAGVTRETFDEAMQRQRAALVELVDGLTDAQWTEQTCTVPWGEDLPLWRGIFELPYRWLAGYRTQLFLYAKGAGASGITTPNLWIGIDWPAPDADQDTRS